MSLFDLTCWNVFSDAQRLEASKILQYLCDQKIPFISAGVALFVPDIDQAITFVHHLNFRARHNNKGSSGIAIDILAASSFDGGGQANIFRSLGVMHVDGEAISLHDGRERLAKMIVPKWDHQGLTLREMEERAIGLASREVRFAAQAGHLGVKPLGMVWENADEKTRLLLLIIMMRKMPGSNLKVFLQQNAFLSPIKKIELCLTVLEAYYQQVFLKGLHHADLKPQNIMVARVADGFKANVVDYGFARSKSEQEAWSFATFTPGYAAAEQYECRTTDTTDIVALGKIFVEVLGYPLAQDFSFAGFLSSMQEADPSCRPSCHEVKTFLESALTVFRSSVETENAVSSATASSSPQCTSAAIFASPQDPLSFMGVLAPSAPVCIDQFCVSPLRDVLREVQHKAPAPRECRIP